MTDRTFIEDGVTYHIGKCVALLESHEDDLIRLAMDIKGLYPTEAWCRRGVRHFIETTKQSGLMTVALAIVAEETEDCSRRNKLVGFDYMIIEPSITGYQAYCNDLIVDAQYRRRGIATKLVSELTEEAKRREVRFIRRVVDAGSVSQGMYLTLGHKLCPPSNSYLLWVKPYI